MVSSRSSSYKGPLAPSPDKLVHETWLMPRGAVHCCMTRVIHCCMTRVIHCCMTRVMHCCMTRVMHCCMTRVMHWHTSTGQIGP